MGTIYSNPDGLRVHFGTRAADEEAGFGETGAVGSFKEVAFTILGSEFVSNVYTGNLNLTLPVGAAIYGNTQVEIVEAFTLGGTSPAINVGVVGTESTNRLVQVSTVTVGNQSIASAGTLAANQPFSTAVNIGVALSGTSPTITSAGRMVVRVTYRDVNAA